MKKLLLIALALGLMGCVSSPGQGEFAWPSEEDPRHFEKDLSLPGEIRKRLGKKLTLARALKVAWRRNATIQAARYRWRAAIEKIPQATSYDDPILTYTYYVRPVETRVGPQQLALQINQKIPFPGKLSLQGLVASRKAEMERVKTARTIRNVLVEVKMAYAEYFYLHRAAEIYKKQKELLERYVAFSAAESGTKKAKLSETFKSQSFLAQMGYEEVVLNEMIITQAQVLRDLLNLPRDVSLGKPEGLAPPGKVKKLSYYIKEGLKHSQEILLAAEKIKKNKTSLTLAQMGHLPDFMFGAKWIETRSAINPSLPQSGKDALMISGGMNLPIWWNRDAARVDEKYYLLKSAQKSLQGVRQKIRRQITRVYFRLSQAERLVKLYEGQLLPGARKAMVTAERSYKEGVTSLASLLETTSVWFNFQLAYWRALTDFQHHRARLERAVGKAISLEKTKGKGDQKESRLKEEKEVEKKDEKDEKKDKKSKSTAEERNEKKKK